MGLGQKIEKQFLKVEVKEYKERFSSNFGELLNPPDGTPDESVLGAVEFLKNIIENLASEWIKQQKNKIVINVYGSENKNAYAFANVDLNGRAIVFDERPIFLRKIWEAENNKSPVLEIGVTLGLLNGEFTEDEIAYILAHELSHLMQGHTHEITDYQMRSSFFSSQIQEVAADTCAIDLMNGKYDINAAYTALNKILSTDADGQKLDEEASKENQLNSDHTKDSDVMVALKNGLSTHHHPAVRLNTIQFYLKYLQYSGELKESKKQSENIDLKIESHQEHSVVSKTKTKLIDYVFSNLQALFIDCEIIDPVAFEHFSTEAEYFYLIECLRQKSQEQLVLQFLQGVSELQCTETQKFIGYNLFLSWLGTTFTEVLVFNSLEVKDKVQALLLSITSKISQDDFHEFEDIILSLHDNNSGFFLDSFSFENLEVLQLSSQNIDFFKGFINSYIKCITHKLELDPNLENVAEFYKHVIKISTSLHEYHDLILDYLIKYENNFNPETICKAYLECDDLELKRSFVYNLTLVVTFRNQTPVNHDIYLELSHFDKVRANLELKNHKFMSAHEFLNQLKENIFLWTIKQVLPGDTHAVLNELSHFCYIHSYLCKATEHKEFVNVDEVFKHFSQCFYQSKLSQKNSIDHFTSIKDGVLELFLNKVLFTKELDKTDFGILTMICCFYDFDDNLSISLSDGKELKWSSFFNILDKEKISQLINLSLDCLDTQMFTDSVNQQKLSLNFMINGLQILTAWDRSKKSKFFMDQDNLYNFLFRIKEIDTKFKRYMENSSMFYLKDGVILSRYSQECFAEILTMMTCNANYSEWLETFLLFHKFGFNKSHFSEEQYKLNSLFLYKTLSDEFPLNEVIIRLSNKALRNLLHSDEFSEILMNYMKSQVINNDRRQIQKTLRKLNDELSLDVEHVEVYLNFRNEIVVHYNIQPHELQLVFIEDHRSKTEKILGFSTGIRYLSATCAVVRSKEFEDQTLFINYIMGRTHTLPDWITEAHNEILAFSNSSYGLIGPLMNLRADLQFRSSIERAFVLNCILTGTGGMAQTEVGQKLILDELTQSVSEDKIEIATDIYNALIKTDGYNCSLFISYVLAQKSTSDKISETQILGALLESFGVPGQKLAQYLAFTNKFKSYYESFKDFQDNVSPVNQYDLLNLIVDKFKTTWPKNRIVKKLIGSGTVNLAVIFEDTDSQQKGVLSILRKGIEFKTKKDFERFSLFIKELNKTGDGKKYFSFIEGLVQVINDSVHLEFDKSNAFKMQTLAYELYPQTKASINTVSPRSFLDHSLLMDFAPGSTAKTIFENDLKKYKQAMGEVLNAEWDILTGLLKPNVSSHLTAFANPDLHDGQIIIDHDQTRIIDFGQAVAINKEDCQVGYNLLKIISGQLSTSAAFDVFKNQLNIDFENVSLDEFTEVIAFNEPMERFVHLISLVGQKNKFIPISSLHWVLAMNRLHQLSQKIDVSLKTKIAELYLTESPILGKFFNIIKKVS